MLSRCLVFKDGCCYLEAAIAAVAAVAAVSDVAGDDAVILVADIAGQLLSCVCWGLLFFVATEIAGQLLSCCLLGVAVFCGI